MTQSNFQRFPLFLRKRRAACFKAVGWSAASLFSGGVAKLCDDNVRSVFVSGGLLLLCAVPLTLWIAKFISPPDRAKRAGAK